MLVLENNLKFLALNVAYEGTEKGTGVAKHVLHEVTLLFFRPKTQCHQTNEHNK